MAEDPVTDVRNPVLRTILTVLTILSTLVTVLLSIGTYSLKKRVDEAEQILKTRAQDLEEARERIARYDYVYHLLLTVEKGSPAQQALAVNTARLALSPQEQDVLFNGLRYSQNEALAEAGRQGVEALSRASVAHEPEPGKIRQPDRQPRIDIPVETPAPPVEPSPSSPSPGPVDNAPPPSTPMPEPVISAAKIDLLTGNDDKDKDAYVSIAIEAGSGETFTWQETRRELWDHETSRTIVLNRVADLPVSSLQAAKIRICLNRTARHGWRFDYFGELSTGSGAPLKFERRGNEIPKGLGQTCIVRPIQVAGRSDER